MDRSDKRLPAAEAAEKLLESLDMAQPITHPKEPGLTELQRRAQAMRDAIEAYLADDENEIDSVASLAFAAKVSLTSISKFQNHGFGKDHYSAKKLAKFIGASWTQLLNGKFVRESKTQGERAPSSQHIKPIGRLTALSQELESFAGTKDYDAAVRVLRSLKRSMSSQPKGQSGVR